MMQNPCWQKFWVNLSSMVLGGTLVFGNGVTEEAKANHWAFQPVERPSLPVVKDKDWVKANLDRFILRRLEKENLKPAPDAPRRVLLRRLSFVLTGLPPSPVDLKIWLEDKTEAPLDKYVDQLIASEEFGVHWARHWLDHVRYRPFGGKTTSNDPFGLWVNQAFNEDMPYDEFVRMQIAGDLLPSKVDDKEVNLDGMIAVRPFSLKNRLFQQLDLLGRTYMGMSLGCARCHDHKHEPLMQDDYFALQGIFESSRTVKLPYLKDKAQFDEYRNGLANKEANEQRMKKELKDFGRVSQLMDLRKRLESERAKLANPKEEKNREKILKNIEKYEKDEKKRLKEIEVRKLKLDDPKALEYIRLNDWNKEFDEKWKQVFLFDAFVDQDDPAKIKDTEPPLEGVDGDSDEDKKGDPVPRRFPVVLAGDKQKPIGEQTQQSGRLELANWLTSKEHPVTARLFVNRVWYYVFGEGLTPSVSNFGHSGQPPSHPELLDFLADEFVKNGWSMKQLIRHMVLSATFQQTSEMDLDDDERDLRISLFGLHRVKRLEVESILRTINQLENNHLPKEKRRDPPHDMKQEMEDLFDGADSSLIVPRRMASVSSLQSLFFLNSNHIRMSTERIAVRLHLERSEDPERIQYIHQLLYGRNATEEEVQTGEAFLAEWEPAIPSNARIPKEGPPGEILYKWQAYLQVLLASNEFLFID